MYLFQPSLQGHIMQTRQKVPIIVDAINFNIVNRDCIWEKHRENSEAAY